MRRALVLLSLPLLTILTLLPVSRAEEIPADAWSTLWSNDAEQAEQLFLSDLERDDDYPDTWRGLLLTQLLTGNDDRIAKTLDKYGKRTQGAPCDWYLPSTIDAYSGLESRNYYSALHKFAKRLSGQKDLSPIDHRLGLSNRLQYALSSGDLRDCRKLAKKLDYVRSWVVLGPFDNTSGAGHGKMHIQNWHVSPQPFQGKYNQTIHWFIPELTALFGTIRPSNYFHESEETTAYLRTVIEIPGSGRYLVSLTHDGDIDLWIDGSLLFEGDRRSGGMEVAHWNVRLDAGPHLIAAKLSNREDTSVLGFAVSSLDGQSVDFEVKPGAAFMVADAPPLDAVELRPAFHSKLAELAESALDGGGNPEDAFWALRQTLRTQSPDSTLGLCRRIESRFPNTAALLVACGIAYNALDEEDDSRRVMASAALLDSSLVLPRLVDIQDNLQKKQHDTALAASDSLLTDAPRCLWALQMKLGALLGQYDLEAVDGLARYLIQEMPKSPIGYDSLAKWADMRGMAEDAKKYEKQAVRRRPPMASHLYSFLQRLKQDEYAEATGAIEDLLDYLPDLSSLYSDLIRSLIAKGDYYRAMETIDTALASFPQNVGLLYQKALFAEHDAYQDQGVSDGKALAAELLGDALNIAPGNFALRDKRRTLAGLTSYREYLPSPDLEDVMALRAEPSEYEGARAVVLRELKRRLFFEDDVSLLDYFVAVQILTSAGVEAWEEHWIDEHPLGLTVIENKTVKPDGTEHEATMYGNEAHFENVEPGDVVVLHYQSVQFQGGSLKGQAWDQHPFAFADPCLESSYELIARERLDIDHALHNAAAHGQPVEAITDSLADGFVAQRWALRDIDGLFLEANATNSFSYQAWLDLSTVPSWQTIASWYSDLAEGQAEVSRVVREKALELCEGAGSRDEIIERIFRFVSQDINYVSVPFYMSSHIPREAEEVLKARFGDCKDKSCLMIAMLEASGVEGARFALIDTWGSRSVEMLPSPRFNHVIVCLSDDAGGYRWFDPTVKYGTSRQVPESLAGGLALIADPSMDQLTVISADRVEDYPSRVLSEAVVAADGTVRVRRRAEDLSMEKTAPRRAWLDNLTARELREDMIVSLVASYPGAVLDTFSVLHQAQIDSALVFDYIFSAPMVFQNSGAFLIGRVPWEHRFSRELSRIVAKQERRSPIDLHRLRSCITEELTLEIPDGYEVFEIPPGLELRFGDCRYITSYELNGEKLFARHEVVFDGDHVHPGKYAEFKKFLDAVLQDQKAPLLLKRSS